jgi:CRISPR-associated protein Csb1
LRDSLLNGTLFRYSDLGKSFADATIRNAAPLFKVCPTGLVFGLWDSTGPRGGLGFKLARNLTSEIVGIDAVFGTKTSSRIDPTGIVKKPQPVFRAADADEQWTLDENRAEKKKGKNGALILEDGKPVPVLYGKKDKAGTTTAINHSNIPPTLDILAGGVTFEKATQTVVLSLAGLRRLSFGNQDDDIAARAALGALGLLAVTAAADRGYDLRSRCQLGPEKGAALAFHTVAKDGTESVVQLDLDAAKALYEAAVHALPDSLRWKNAAGVPLKQGEPLERLIPAPKLIKLIEESRKLAVAEEVEDEG